MVCASNQSDARFSVLLTEDREHAIEHWTRQLPRLLQPLGMRALVAQTGYQAIELVESRPIHAAVIDLYTPPGDRKTIRTKGAPRPAANPATPGGIWVLEIFRRLANPPPVVVVNNLVYSPRQAQRFLNKALRLGAFSVINRPVDLEELLTVIRRLIDRQYEGQWPHPPGTDPAATDRHSP